MSDPVEAARRDYHHEAWNGGLETDHTWEREGCPGCAFIAAIRSESAGTPLEALLLDRATDAGLDVERLARAIGEHPHDSATAEHYCVNRGHVERCAPAIAAEYARLSSSDTERLTESYATDRCLDCGELTVNRVHHDERLGAYHTARLSSSDTERSRDEWLKEVEE